MGIREIPARTIFECDGCGKAVDEWRTADWLTIHMQCKAFEWQNQALADASANRLLCGNCGEKVALAINKALEAVGGTDG